MGYLFHCFEGNEHYCNVSIKCSPTNNERGTEFCVKFWKLTPLTLLLNTMCFQRGKSHSSSLLYLPVISMDPTWNTWLNQCIASRWIPEFLQCWHMFWNISCQSSIDSQGEDLGKPEVSPATPGCRAAHVLSAPFGALAISEVAVNDSGRLHNTQRYGLTGVQLH